MRKRSFVFIALCCMSADVAGPDAGEVFSRTLPDGTRCVVERTVRRERKMWTEEDKEPLPPGLSRAPSGWQFDIAEYRAVLRKEGGEGILLWKKKLEVGVVPAGAPYTELLVIYDILWRSERKRGGVLYGNGRAVYVDIIEYDKSEESYHVVSSQRVFDFGLDRPLEYARLLVRQEVYVFAERVRGSVERVEIWRVDMDGVEQIYSR